MKNYTYFKKNEWKPKELLFIIFLASFFTGGLVNAQLIVSNSVIPSDVVQNVLVGTGVVVSNVTYTGYSNSIGTFYGGSSTNLGLAAGIMLSSGDVVDAKGPNNSGSKGINTGYGSDAQLASLIPGYTIYDASVLQFDFIPMSDTVRFNYIFGSEEYPEWVSSPYNDVFGFFISGPNPSGGSYANKNVAVIPGTSLPVSIDNVNNVIPSYPQYYVNNIGGSTIQFDGFTTVLTAKCNVVPCQSYHIKIAIGDAGDHIYDSDVFLEKNSFSSPPPFIVQKSFSPAIDTFAIEGCSTAKIKFIFPSPLTSPYTINYTISGSATNGVDYSSIPSSITVPAGQDNASITINPSYDGVNEGYETVILQVPTSACNMETVQVTIKDNNPLIVTASSDVTICSGSAPVSVSAANGISPYSYQWNDITAGFGSSITVSPASTTTYIVTVSDVCGNTASDNVTVNIAPLTVSISNNQTICPGQTVPLTAGGGNIYKWNNGQTTSTINVSPASTATYTVSVYGNAGCSDVKNVVVSVNSSSIADAGNDVAVCTGSNAVLNASGGVSYAWSNGSTNTSIQVSPASATVYTVTVTNSYGCTDDDNVTVFVNPLPNVSAGADKTICNGSYVNLSASGTGNYLWNTSAATSGINVNPGLTTVYTVTITDASGCQNSDNVTVFVNPLPNINAGVDMNICGGQSAVITANGGSSYVWNNFQTTNSINVQPLNTSTYLVTGTDNNGCKNTDEIIISVNPSPVADAGNNVNICSGQNTVLNASGGLFYNWNTSIAGASVQVNPNITTVYTVTVTNSYGCTDDDNVTVFVNPLPNVSAGADKTICNGNSVNLSASGTGNYLWNTSDATSGINVNPGLTTVYTVTITDASGCQNSDNVTVFVNPLPNINAGVDMNICGGQSAVITANGGTSYVWNNSQTTGSINVQPASTSTYIVTGTDNNGCKNTDEIIISVNPSPVAEAGGDVNICTGNSVVLSASGGVYYAWNNGSINASIQISPVSTTVYIVTVTDNNGCTDDDNVTVALNSSPVANAGADVAICMGESVQLNAGGGVWYLWNTTHNVPSISVAPSVTTMYTVTVIDGNSCSGQDEVIVDVISPTVSAGSDINICTGSSATISATGSGTYLWNTGQVSSTIVVMPSATTVYTVTVTDQGCTAFDDITVAVKPLPAVSFTADILNGCAPFTVNFAENSSPQGLNFLWSFDDPLSGSNNSSASADPTHVFAQEGTYNITLEVTTGDGCSGTYSFNNMITAYPSPVADFTYNPNPGSAIFSKITFYDESIDAVSWKWDFGEVNSANITTSTAATQSNPDNTSTLQNPVHNYTVPGSYTVRLEVLNSFGCNDIVYKMMEIKKDFTFYMPDAFSPDNDGLNDILLPKGIGISEENYKMYVFNRWGQMIFESKDLNTGWDGTYEDKVCPNAVYTCLVYFNDLNNWEHMYVGRVTLMH